MYSRYQTMKNKQHSMEDCILTSSNKDKSPTMYSGLLLHTPAYNRNCTVQVKLCMTVNFDHIQFVRKLHEH